MFKNRLFKVILASLLLIALIAPVAVLAGDYGLQKTASKLGYVTTSQETLAQLILQWLKVILSFTSIIFLGFTLYAGVRWLTARGKEDLISKAKETLQGTITGLIIVSMSYAIVTFVLQKIGVVDVVGCCYLELYNSETGETTKSTTESMKSADCLKKNSSDEFGKIDSIEGAYAAYTWSPGKCDAYVTPY